MYYFFFLFLFFVIFLFIFFKGGDFILNFKKFGDIHSVYNIVDITDEYIISKENDKINYIYIYEIDPIQIINISDDIKNNILNSYVSFLREMNVDFQILIINKKLKLDNIFSDNSKEKYDKYLQDMRVKIKEDKIFYTKYYIVVALKKHDSIEEIDKIITLLKNCGCNVNRINTKKDIKNILYECINKEDVV